jgi:ATP-dependent DNA helicase PIF1
MNTLREQDRNSSSFPKILKIALRLMVIGVGGSGKSEIIKLFTNILKDACIVCSYMAAATQILRGVTLHWLFKLPVNVMGHGQMSDASLEEVKENLKGVKLIIIDEFFMIGLRTLCQIDKRLR